MNTIKRLDEDVINKIAAGEVVERPASVVKELTENAIDAGAAQIRIELQKGGKDLIIVSDDGKGMSENDLPLAMLRHATSKISGAEDLFALQSMGFRGEALASISAVADVLLASKVKGGEGWQIKDSDMSDLMPWSGPVGADSGTTISVAHLFAKIPARLAFLKSDNAEFGAVQEIVTQLALAHPAIGFQLLHNGKSQCRWERCASTDPLEAARQRCRQVLGDESAKGLLAISESNRFVTISGFVSPPGLERPTGRQIFLFVNGRAIKDKNLRFALQRAYESHLLKGKSPVAVLHFAMDPTLVDVNVHPAKTEVRFQYPLEVEGALVRAVRAVLRSGSWAMPMDMEALAAPAFVESAVTDAAVFASMNPSSPSFVSEARSGGVVLAPERETSQSSSYGSRGVSTHTAQRSFALRERVKTLPPFELGGNPLSDDLPSKPAATPDLRVLWSETTFLGTFGKLYLLFQWQDYLLVVDQHAFHERILFERFMADPKLLKSSQKLLVPESIEVDAATAEAAEMLAPSLKEWGYDIRVLNGSVVEFLSVPAILKTRDLESLLFSLVKSETTNAKDHIQISHHHLIATAACHSAVRGGEELTDSELAELIRQASTVDFFHNCPHGRRVFAWWHRNDVNKMFDRPSGGTSFSRNAETSL